MDNKALYIKLAGEQKDLPLFMQPWWMDIVCKDWNVALVPNGDKIAGSWAYPIEKKLGVTMMRTPLLTPYLGPKIFYPDDIKESNTDRFEHDTVSALLKQLPEAKVWHLSMPPGLKQAGIFKNYDLDQSVQQTFLVDLSMTEELLLANMKDTMRRNIRAAEKEVEIVNDPSCLKQLFEFQKQTLTKKGNPPAYSFAYLDRIMKACLANNSAALWVAKANGNIQAIVWQVWDNNSSYYFMGGQNQEANSYKAMSLLLWHVIKDAKNRGQSTFDLEGSMDDGVERFFRNFGGRRELYLVLHKNDSVLWQLKKMVRK